MKAIPRPLAFVHNPDLGLLMIRLILGVVGMYHGSQKLFGAFGGHGLGGFATALGKMGIPAPEVSAVLSSLAEFGGGLLIALGLFPRLGAIAFAFNMLVAVTVVHRHAFGAQNQGMEYPLTLLVVSAAIIFTGGGRYSLPRLFAAGRRETGTHGRLAGA